MTQHYTRGVLEDTSWCNRCQRRTQHAVSSGRLAHCLEHGPAVNREGLNKKQAAAKKKRAHASQNPSLFPREREALQ